MENHRNRSFGSETRPKPVGTPKSSSPGSHRQDDRQLDSVSPFQSDETLESAFSRLNFNDQYSHSGYNGDFSHGFNAPMGLPLGWREQKTEQDVFSFNNNNNNLQSTDANSLSFTGFQDHVFNGNFNSGLDPTLNNYNHYRELAINQNGLSNGAVLNNRSVLNPDVPYIQRPEWMQEPLGFLRVRDLRGRIVTLAKDQNGCRFLQNTLGSLTEEELEMVFLEMVDHVCELMVDPFGNYVVQKLIELCGEEQRTQILLKLVRFDSQLVRICLNMHGTRVVQKLLQNLTTPRQLSIVSAAISNSVVALTKDTNGHHVIDYCLKHFPAETNKYILNQLADNCYAIATNRSGCCVLQHCIDYSKGEQRNRLLSQIIANALPLAEDPFGNYVVQHILDLRIPQATQNLLRQLQGSFISLSFNKFGSNVVEKCLNIMGEHYSMIIIYELLSSQEVYGLLTDPYGNYVIQSALAVSKGLVHKALVDLIWANYPRMKSNIYGKKLLACFDKRKTLYRLT